MSTTAYQQIISASPQDRQDLFLATANRLGTQHVALIGRGRLQECDSRDAYTLALCPLRVGTILYTHATEYPTCGRRPCSEFLHL